MQPTGSAPLSGDGPPTTATRLGKRGASPEPTFLFSPMARSVVRLVRNCSHRNDEERADGSLRVVYAASIRSCRPCSLREQCQWQGGATKKPRQVSVLLHPLVVGSAPLLWHDWSRRRYRRACIQLLRSQRVDVQHGQDREVRLVSPPATLSRAQRAHYRLSLLSGSHAMSGSLRQADR